MASTSPSPFRLAPHHSVLAPLALLSAALTLVGGCSTPEGKKDQVADDGAGGSVVGAGAVGGAAAGVGGAGAAVGGGAGGSAVAQGGVGNGGVSTGAGGGVMQGGGTSTGGEPCVDVEPPYDPEWPDADCSRWALETDACTESWFSEYCDASCGRCTPSGAGGAPMEEPCLDVEPPYDPEWPDATCYRWATESTACEEAWFGNYCDASCGRCIPEDGVIIGPGEPIDCSGEGLPTVSGGEGFATRYWDCCQTHCSQWNGHRCSQDGVSNTGDGNSACQGGGSFACYDEAPYAVSDCLSYGHIAKASPDCGGCYRIEFTGEGEHNANDPGSKLIAGKQMVVKVSNTGGDVAHNQFDLMIPGGGVGQFNACSRQWGTDQLGAQYGGFLTSCYDNGARSQPEKEDCVRQECMKIPEGSARDGCLWFVDWFHVADNPKFRSQQTDCPF